VQHLSFYKANPLAVQILTTALS